MKKPKPLMVGGSHQTIKRDMVELGTFSELYDKIVEYRKEGQQHNENYNKYLKTLSIIELKSLYKYWYNIAKVNVCH